MYQDTCTMQLQIYIIFEKLWNKMSFMQRLKSSYTMTRFEFRWKMISESRNLKIDMEVMYMDFLRTLFILCLSISSGRG